MRTGDVDRGESDEQSPPRGDRDERVTEGHDANGGTNALPELRSPNLFEILRARVRAASDGQLVLCASLGVAGLVALVIIRRWPWAAIAVCGVLLGAGLWGVLDRTRAAPALLGREVPLVLVTIARLASGVLALLSLLALMLGAFGLCLGPWIS
ncbi:MAG TPA: hypothetical protein VIQ60_12560 [Gemmatimonadaceae bacterium]